MLSRFERLMIAIMFALLVAGVTLVFAQAQGGGPTTTPVEKATADNCADCHKEIYDNWQNSLHGQSTTDTVFINVWNAQGQPGACLVCHTTGYDPATGKSQAQSVSCIACHNPMLANHPVDNMPVDKTPDSCSKCHSDPRFSTDNWKMSAHYQRSMTCTVCHDAHTAGMKTVVGSAPTTDASDLCINCHKDAMKNFPTSKHAEAGVTCVQCHLGFGVNDTSTTGTVDFVNAHKAPDHSFVPTLATCNKCHANQMHGPGEAAAASAIKVEEIGGTATPVPTDVVTPVPPVTNQPAPVSPIGFASMAGLIGLAGGMVLAPWLEKLYRRMVRGGKNV